MYLIYTVYNIQHQCICNHKTFKGSFRRVYQCAHIMLMTPCFPNPAIAGRNLTVGFIHNVVYGVSSNASCLFLSDSLDSMCPSVNFSLLKQCRDRFKLVKHFHKRFLFVSYIRRSKRGYRLYCDDSTIAFASKFTEHMVVAQRPYDESPVFLKGIFSYFISLENSSILTIIKQICNPICWSFGHTQAHTYTRTHAYAQHNYNITYCIRNPLFHITQTFIVLDLETK